jgi:hypothetical protein
MRTFEAKSVIPGKTAEYFHNCTPGYDGDTGVWGTCAIDAYLNELIDFVKTGVSAHTTFVKYS